ncbi:MAG: hypothetical protein RIA63_07165, partial [Cyclobacteriaceae bacterium]
RRSSDLPIVREEMMQLYSGGSNDQLSSYHKNGEIIPRTAAWISVLILLFTFVKTKTTKR